MKLLCCRCCHTACGFGTMMFVFWASNPNQEVNGFIEMQRSDINPARPALFSLTAVRLAGIRIESAINKEYQRSRVWIQITKMHYVQAMKYFHFWFFYLQMPHANMDTCFNIVKTTLYYRVKMKRYPAKQKSKGQKSMLVEFTDLLKHLCTLQSIQLHQYVSISIKFCYFLLFRVIRTLIIGSMVHFLPSSLL